MADPNSRIRVCMASLACAQLGLDLRRLLEVLGRRHGPLRIVQRTAQVLLRSRDGLLGHVLGAGLHGVSRLLQGLSQGYG